MKYRAVGVMSGTSLDGLDIVLCDFETKEVAPNFEIQGARTFDFPSDLLLRLAKVRSLSALELQELHLDLGYFIGTQVQALLQELNVDSKEVDYIASHGHTVFHQPEKRITVQIGCGQEIARVTGIKTINNFREKDVRLGGQGAPLVPVGDRDLFAANYHCDAFLNLGGFANISVLKAGKLTAFDLCPCNLVFNQLSSKRGLAYDAGGALGQQGRPNQDLLQALKALPYFQQEHPKSLGAEWLEQHFNPLLKQNEDTVENQLRTVYELLAWILQSECKRLNIRRILTTGGGAKNDFLLALSRENCPAEIIVPEIEMVDFKEALVFAYLGYCFLENKPNCLREVTGASEDSVGGVCYIP